MVIILEKAIEGEFFFRKAPIHLNIDLSSIYEDREFEITYRNIKLIIIAIESDPGASAITVPRSLELC